jgi:putative CocE/NonD family hydrolase
MARSGLANIAWLGAQTGYKGKGEASPTGGWDDYDNFREVGSAGDWAKKSGYDQLPFWRRMSENPEYNAFWQGQALDKLVAANPSNVPTLWEQGLWDQEDIWGAIVTWEALRAKGKLGNNFLVMGPWRHSQINREGRSLGPFQWNGDTAAQFREQMVLPLFDQHLKDGPPANLPAAAIYNTGLNRWDRFADWPLACETGCAGPLTPLYLQASGGLGFERASSGGDSYVSDPAKPVPHLPRPVNFNDGRWDDWLVQDQRFADGRPDVMTYRTPVLTKAVRVAGAPIADIWAKTTGTDADVVVKLIDVHPAENATDPEDGRLSAGGQHGHLPRALSQGLRQAFAHSRRPGAALSLSAADGEITSSSRGTASWCRSSRACSRSMTAIRRPMCPTSSSPSRATTRRRR